MLFETIENLSGLFSAPRKFEISGQNVTLAELAGYSAQARLLIINADDFGLCSSTNHAVEDLIESGQIRSTSLFANSNGFEEAVSILKRLNIGCGIHLTLTSEWRENILRPVLPAGRVRSLLDGSGHFFSDIRELYASAKIGEVEMECRAQIEKVAETGVEIDHLDTHMGAMQLHPEYIRVYIKLASEFHLPIRMGSERLAKLMNLPIEFLTAAREEGLVFPDNLIYIPMSFAKERDERLAAYEYAIRKIPAGITEMYFHPSLNGDDFRILSHHYSSRKEMSYESIRLWDYEYLSSGRLARLLEKENITTVDYKVLKKAMEDIDRSG
jgi:predicted glycoside hydrolase/deacetylase ChbG (UPF0249 family)